MKGLILQELYSMKQMLRFYLIVLAMYTVLGYIQGNFSGLGTVWIMISGIVYVNTFSYREKSKWDLYAATMPVSRRQMIRAIYAVSFLFLGGAVLMGVLFNLADVLVFQKEFGELILGTGAAGLLAILYLSIFIPILVRFGSEKGRMLLFAVFLVPVMVIYLAVRIFGIDDATIELLIQNGMTIGIAAAVAALCISYRISVLLYAGKEF